VKRFLFLMSDTGGGHRAPAQAVGDELIRLYGAAAQVELCDVFVELGLWPFSQFPRLYPKMVRLHSVPWGISYRLTDHADFMQRASSLAWPYTSDSLRDLLRRHAPDVIVSFHPIPNYAILRAVRRMGLRAPVAIVATDLVSVHAGWFAPGAHSYYVPTADAKRRALRWHVPPDKVHVSGGMPVRRAFLEARQVTQAAARAQLGLPQELPVVLMVGGGDGMGPLEDVVRAVAARQPEAHLVAIAGRNGLLQQKLRSLDTPVPLWVEGFVHNMAVWMRAADLLVTKAGPNTLSEAFVSGLPVVIYSAILGQEEGNVVYVEENRLGVWAKGPERAAKTVMSLLGDRARCEEMAQRAITTVRPDVAELLARRLWQIGQERSSLAAFAEATAPWVREY